ncbi:hypothetical protein K4F52_000295 [Lecanicillium sp. MT-2017a]|nr:hypothetical protein K4F52_000295 [Lecanicillium sp. MT-2017a]
MRLSTLIAGVLASTAAAADKNYLGFNSGNKFADHSAKFKKDFEAEFKTAQGLKGAPGTFNAVRLYTCIQAYAEDDPIEAFEAAIETETYMLLGIWATGVESIDKELSALKKAVDKHGSKFTDLVIGMSIGSEDLYRDSVTGRKNDAGEGNSPEAIVGFIKDFKDAFSSGPLSSVPVGHVDTWDAWTNSTIQSVIKAVDWVGVDEYPFYESGKGNDIKNAGTLFDRAYEATIGAANGKPVWVTETGWPYVGPDWDQAVASVENAKYYWDEVGCRQLFGKTPTFWYTLRDSNPDNKVKFAITEDLSTTPRFNLTCPTTFDTPDKSESSAVPSGTSSPSASGTGMAPSASSTSGGSGARPGGSGAEAGVDTTDSADKPASTGKDGKEDKDSASSKFGASAYAAALAIAGAYLLL